MIRRRKLTPAIIEAYLEVLAETGVKAWAALAVLPHLSDGTSANATFASLARRDGVFAARQEAALQKALSRLEKVAMDRAVNGMDEPIVWRGEITGSKKVFDNKLLAFMLSRRLPETYGDRKEVAITGEVQHSHTHAAVPISLNDVNRLSPDQRRQLKAVLETISDNRALPAPFAEDDIEDAEFEAMEVDDGG
ncbi:MAG: hypothetical protein IT548_18050 [Alphaproteobacteria bacterium]|nr:hypothetical protein [Alphaproteobacteria bacterium]